MIQFNNTNIKTIALHKVGNKYKDEPLILSKKFIELDDLTGEILSRYFLSKFNFTEFYTFFHQIDIKYNEVYSIIDRIFTNKNINIADTIDIYTNKVYTQRQKEENFILHTLKIA